jgi:hypothetical protein
MGCWALAMGTSTLSRVSVLRLVGGQQQHQLLRAAISSSMSARSLAVT